jgi:hypothetical protein
MKKRSRYSPKNIYSFPSSVEVTNPLRKISYPCFKKADDAAAIAASQNSVCITQQMCHKMILIKDKSARKNLYKICHFLKNIGFLMMGKLASQKKRFVI